MKKMLIVSVFSSILMSCGLLFTTSNTPVNTLQLSDGTYLSTDEYNEITPFAFHDTTGISYLFFSSDRSNSYDIYYSIINPDGTFGKAVMLPSPVNQTNSDEMYPVVLFDGFYYIMAFIRIVTNQTNVLSADTDNPVFTTASMGNVLTGNFTGLGYIENVSGEYVTVSSNHNARLYFIPNNEGLDFNDLSITNLLSPSYSANGFTIPIQNGHSDLYIKGVKSGAIFQIAAEMMSKTTIITQIYMITYTNTIILSNIIPLDPYISAFNDISPFVDTKDSYKVYFASDRYNGDSHKGDYDLYRYNIYTFFNLPATGNILASDKSAPTVTFIGVTNGETNYSYYIDLPVKVADNICGYYFTKVFISTNGLDYSEISKVDYNTFDQLWYYNFSFPSDGFYTFHCYAVDWFGNVSSTNTYNMYYRSI
ncbi:MAG: hypothetical protein A2014_02565 [Spirochaetes bacterium GWF1_49_6]|nr:MAG: hypothetical protein A2014_02565 [Spirochaetes bacterium GWF1_49_6]